MKRNRLLAAVLLCWTALFTAAGAQTPMDDARALMAEGRYLDAARVLETVVGAEPVNAAAWNILGAANNYGENYRRANEAAERAVELAPDTPRFRFNRALTRWEVGNFEGALADHDFVLARDPRAANALTERGAVLAALGRFDEAEASWAASLAADPNYIWAHFYRGQAQMAQGRYAEAAASFTLVLEREDFYPARLWSWVAHRRASLSAPDLGSQDAWPGAIGAHLRGDISARALERAAHAARLNIDDRRLVSALYFIAQKALAEGRPSAARRALRRIRALDTPALPERVAADWEFARLGRP